MEDWPEEDGLGLLARLEGGPVLGADYERVGQRHRGENAGALGTGEGREQPAIPLTNDCAGEEAAAVIVPNPLFDDYAHGRAVRAAGALAHHLEDRRAAEKLES